MDPISIENSDGIAQVMPSGLTSSDLGAARLYRAVGRTAEERALAERAHAVMQCREQSPRNERDRDEAASLPLRRLIAAAFQHYEGPSSGQRGQLFS